MAGARRLHDATAAEFYGAEHARPREYNHHRLARAGSIARQLQRLLGDEPFGLLSVVLPSGKLFKVDNSHLREFHEQIRRLMTRYDSIGHGYSRTRREDPRFREQIQKALGQARSVVNVGAGTGGYEPTDRHVIAIEPSDIMAAQRSRELAPAIRGSGGNIPLRDGSVDAAMAVLTIHHWDEERERGVRELRRVARDTVVILTYDAAVSGKMWLMADYLPEVAALDQEIFPSLEDLTEWLGGDVRVEKLPIPRDTPDWMLGSFWAHPERVLDPDARAATSGFARMSADVVERVVSEISRDLASGVWDERFGHLRTLDAFDVGLRLVVSTTN